MKKILFLSLLSVLAFSGCYKPEIGVWDELVIKEGKHRSKPYDLTWNDNVNVAYRWQFTESCQYDLEDNDQCDWNKLTGFSFNFKTNHKNSLLIGWRWDLAGYWWVSPYYHLDGHVKWADASCSGQEIEDLTVDPNLVPLAIYPGQEFETHFTIRSDLKVCIVTIIVPETGSTTYFELALPEDDSFGNTREIYPWFGGNETAPHEMTIKRLLIDSE